MGFDIKVSKEPVRVYNSNTFADDLAKDLWGDGQCIRDAVERNDKAFIAKEFYKMWEYVKSSSCVQDTPENRKALTELISECKTAINASLNDVIKIDLDKVLEMMQPKKTAVTCDLPEIM